MYISGNEFLRKQLWPCTSPGIRLGRLWKISTMITRSRIEPHRPTSKMNQVYYSLHREFLRKLFFMWPNVLSDCNEKKELSAPMEDKVHPAGICAAREYFSVAHTSKSQGSSKLELTQPSK